MKKQNQKNIIKLRDLTPRKDPKAGAVAGWGKRTEFKWRPR